MGVVKLIVMLTLGIVSSQVTGWQIQMFYYRTSQKLMEYDKYRKERER